MMPFTRYAQISNEYIFFLLLKNRVQLPFDTFDEEFGEFYAGNANTLSQHLWRHFDSISQLAKQKYLHDLISYSIFLLFRIIYFCVYHVSDTPAID